MLKFFKVYIFSLYCTTAFAQETVKPADGKVLNYTHILFEYAAPKAKKYDLHITDITNGKKPVKTVIKNVAQNEHLITDGLTLGKQYEWYVSYTDSKGKQQQTPTSHFSIGNGNTAIKNGLKFEIKTALKGRFENDIQFLDNVGVAIDRKGQIVWYMPDKEEFRDDKNMFRALQMTHDGTLLFINNGNCIETDLEGNELWRAPRTAQVDAAGEEYHHDCYKTKYGTYMVASYQYLAEKNYYNEAIDARVRYNTILEFDKYKNLLWHWSEKKNVPRSVIFQQELANSTEVAGTHLNGFSFNEEKGYLYASFRNTSQIMQIKYPEGNVLYTWDGKLDSKIQTTGISFYQQHGPSQTSAGDVIVYNNNINLNNRNSKILYPTVIILQNSIGQTTPKKLWEYDATWLARKDGIQGKEGYAKQLTNGNILIGYGGANRTIEVNKNKQITWDCQYYQYNADSAKYLPFNNYRCSNAYYLHSLAIGVKYDEATQKLMLRNLGAMHEYEIKLLQADGSTEAAKLNKKIAEKETIEINIKQYKDAKYVFIQSKTNDQYKKIVGL